MSKSGCFKNLYNPNKNGKNSWKYGKKTDGKSVETEKFNKRNYRISVKTRRIGIKESEIYGKKFAIFVFAGFQNGVGVVAGYSFVDIYGRDFRQFVWVQEKAKQENDYQ